MSNAIVSNVYRYVIDDVINQVRGDFEDMGIDDSILQELQRSWESKVARSRVANFGFKDNGYYEDDNGAAGGGGVGGSSEGPNNTHVGPSNDSPALQYPTEYGHAMNNNTPSAASLANLAATATAVAQGNRPMPQAYGLPPPNTSTNVNRMIPDPSTLVNQYQMMPHNQNKPNTLPDLPLPRPHLPQNDGGNDLLSTEEIDQKIHDMIQQSQEEEEGDISISFTASSSITGEPLALDSLPDSVKELIREARQKHKRTAISQLDGEGDTPQAPSEDDINSDLDDSDDDDEEGEGGEEIEHIILCLYDKVTRTKNKWKCILKDGIMLVNGRDYLFHRANGDFEW